MENIKNIPCCFNGNTPAEVARIYGNVLANSEDFILFCYWAECVEGEYLEDLDTVLERYYIDENWKEFRRRVERNEVSGIKYNWA